MGRRAVHLTSRQGIADVHINLQQLQLAQDQAVRIPAGVRKGPKAPPQKELVDRQLIAADREGHCSLGTWPLVGYLYQRWHHTHVMHIYEQNYLTSKLLITFSFKEGMKLREMGLMAVGRAEGGW